MAIWAFCLRPLRFFYFQFTHTLRTVHSNVLAAGGCGRQKGKKRMSIEEVSAERFAQLFHHYHQALGNDSGNAAHLRTCDAWANVPPSEKNRMIAATRLALLEVEVIPSERESRRYFAKPGEAEWGC
jgi:hypothetical protein